MQNCQFFLTARANNKLLSSSRIYKKINQNLICLLFKGFFLRVFSFFKIRMQKEFDERTDELKRINALEVRGLKNEVDML